MNKTTVFLFSGQGSHYFHMGRQLFLKNAVFRKWMHALNETAVSMTGSSVLDRLYDDRKTESERFDRLVYTHPAIFMVEYSLARTLLEEGIYPDHVLGTSLGEFAAAAVAGIAGVEEMLEAVIKQAASIEAASEPGGMIAIIHDARLFKEAFIHENADLASVNYDTHFVISGNASKLNEIEHLLKKKQILHQVLPVLYGFHSAGIDPSATLFKNYLSGKSFRRPRHSFISSLHGSALTEIHQNYFWDIARRPIRFRDALGSLEKAGSHCYVDLGPGGTLANFAKRNIRDGSMSECHAVITPFHRDLGNLEMIKQLAAHKTFTGERKAT